jgi:hypothetical protein
MCLIAYVPKGVKYPIKDIEKQWNYNPHGLGIAILRGINKEPIIIKGMDSLSSARAELAKHSKHERVVHFRYATQGTVDADNCHPHRIDSESWLFHNGHIHGFGNNKESDTKDYCKRVLSRVDFNTKMDLLENNGGKFVLIIDGVAIVIGAGWTQEEGGILYSNKNWQAPSFFADSFDTTQERALDNYLKNEYGYKDDWDERF